MNEPTEETIAPFRARARILALMGDQLIGSDQLAIFELVKNAYDADASGVSVTLDGLGVGQPVITVIDDGDGMDLETITSIWLEPASDHREIQRLEKRRTKIFNRLPLGEKGVGRFAVHKLGHRIDLVTRPRGADVEHSVSIDWDALTAVRYLDETRIKVTTGTPTVFTEANGRPLHGVMIVIRALRKRVWGRREVRQLHRSITAISSPFSTADAFHADLHIPEHREWLEGMPDVKTLMEQAPWRFQFRFDGQLDWDYQFVSPLGRRLTGREISEKGAKLLLQTEPGAAHSPVADAAVLEGIGPISGTLLAYDRDRKVLALLPQSTTLKQFLDNQGGVRVYRDGVRVYNYGEPSDDWLQMDLRRVNRPAQRLSRNLVVGAVNLDRETSTGLVEKTNREGFDENDGFDRFRSVIIAIIHRFEVERALDKDRMKRLMEESSDKDEILVETPLRHLREAVAATSQAAQILPIVDRVEAEFVEMRDLLLRAGMSGLNLGIIIHEVEKGVRALHDSVRSGSGGEILEKQSRNLMGLIENVGGLLREKDKDGVDLRELIHTMAAINVRRFQRHQVWVTYDLPESGETTKVPGSSALLQNVLMNLIDNAIYWLRVRWPDQPESAPKVRRIHVAITQDLLGGPALVVADNGPGFQDVPEVVAKPFFTRRPDGTGLGLYYASLAMSLANGDLNFPDREDLDLPAWADGAVVAMQFSGFIE